MPETLLPPIFEQHRHTTHGLPFLATALGACAILSLYQHGSLGRGTPQVRPPRSISVDLRQDDEAAPPVLSPYRTLQSLDPEHRLPEGPGIRPQSPAGGGHEPGHTPIGAMDLQPLVNLAPPAVTPSLLPTGAPPGSSAGANGHGTGYGSGTGSGSGFEDGSGQGGLPHQIVADRDLKALVRGIPHVRVPAGTPMPSGAVWVRALVDATGVPSQILAVNGDPRLRGAAQEAAAHWRFENPITRGFKPPVVVWICFLFSVKTPESTPTQISTQMT